MGERRLYRAFFILGALLCAVFAALVCRDVLHYSAAANSAPLWAFVLVRAVELLLPAAAAFALGLWLRRRDRRRQG